MNLSMYNINISLNKPLIETLKHALDKKGYNNVSEYIRDLLRRDLFEEERRYPYDTALLNELAREAREDAKRGRLKKVKTVGDLLK